MPAVSAKQSFLCKVSKVQYGILTPYLWTLARLATTSTVKVLGPDHGKPSSGRRLGCVALSPVQVGGSSGLIYLLPAIRELHFSGIPTPWLVRL